MLGRVYLGRYETLRPLGEGGMGRVYLARQIDLGRLVVVKVMHDEIAEDPKFRQRFQRETLLMARFQHPYVVTLFDASLDSPDGPCIVMEYVKGVTLEEMLAREGRMTPHRFSRLLGQLCEALHAAHNAGIIHRDLKPANLMVVDADTPFEKVKVMDFGLAKLTEANHVSLSKNSDTGHEFAVGTPGYISPEQVRGKAADHRSDIYSLGVILYEVLTGHQPFTGNVTADVLLAHANEAPPPFSEYNVDRVVPPELERLVRRCLAKNPEERPQSAQELFACYQRALVESSGRDTITFTPDDMRLLRGEVEEDESPPQRQSETQAAVDDPSAMIYHVDAWLPEAIASYKLRGFVSELGGEIRSSEPGKMVVYLDGRRRFWGSFLGLSRAKNGPVELELQMERRNPKQPSSVSITVILRPCSQALASSPAWPQRAADIFCQLRGFLMANGHAQPAHR